MALSAFDDKTHQPNEDDLRSTLGAAYTAWCELIGLVSSRIPDVAPLWGFTGKSTGWGLRLRVHERILLYMTPCKGHFLVSFALGEKAVQSARAAKLPKNLLSTIDAAPRYAEGRGVRIPVRQSRQISALASLAEIKHRN